MAQLPRNLLTSQLATSIVKPDKIDKERVVIAALATDISSHHELAVAVPDPV